MTTNPMMTILIATKNRPEFIQRFLEYLVVTGYTHWISIGDSNVGSYRESMKEIVAAFDGRLRIKYLSCPEAGVVECHRQLMETISTPYTACISDGSFLVPRSLEKCMEFLENHPDYSIAHGRGTLFSLKSEGPYGEFDHISLCPLPKREEETAVERLTSHLNNYTVSMYCVYRSEIWKKAWEHSFSMKDQSFAAELLPCCLTVVYGKAKELDCLYMMRHMHNRRSLLPNIFDWITNADWQPSYQLFCSFLSEALVKKDNVAVDRAREIVKEAFWAYFRKGMNAQYAKRQKNRQWHVRVKNQLKSIPGMRKTGRSVKSIFSLSKGIAWPALLRKNSVYHADFMPIYKIVSHSSPQRQEKSLILTTAGKV